VISNMSDKGVEYAHHDGGDPEREGLRLVVYVPGGEPIPVYVKSATDDVYVHAGNIKTRRGAPFIGDDLLRVDGSLLVVDTRRCLGVPVYGRVESCSGEEVEATRSLLAGYGDLLDSVDAAVPGMAVGPRSMFGN
jgi:hypothetical protein